MLKHIFTSILVCIYTIAFTQSYQYNIDIKNIVKDQVAVTCKTPAVSSNSIIYHFPKVVPGTYAVEDYGKYITNFKAFDKIGNKLSVKKIGNNDFEINNATILHSIQYLVNDAMDKRVRKNKIFEPASTNIEINSNILINNGGFFGYLDGTEKLPIQLTFIKPSAFFGATSLTQSSFSADEQGFTATSYHQLVDCPILFATPDTAKFYINNTLVTIACFDKSGKKRAATFYNELKRDMNGIATFLPKLPVDNYTFLVYVDDFVEYGPIITGDKKPKLSQIIPLIRKFSKLGVGALEHGNSSCYYLANFGDSISKKELSVNSQLTDAAIHEFMHIITPLSLHSQHIGDFNYAQPIMSKHLWLYEGCTEYFAHLIKLQAGIYTKEKFLQVMQGKIKSAASYPWETMSFTKMSANCLEKKYNKQYIHVYDRGAVYAMLLDAKIILATNGKKTLKDVILYLVSKYGKNNSFEEDAIFAEFNKVVGPGLETFFATIIDGNQDYNLTKELESIGILYQDRIEINAPINPFNNELNDIEIKKSMLGVSKIKSVGPAEWAGLQADDVSIANSYNDVFKPEGKFVAEGQLVNLTIKRNKKQITIPIKVKYAKQFTNYYLGDLPNATETQQKNWKVFSNGK
jgi:predicted metalloprotease with PDZ domain